MTLPRQVALLQDQYFVFAVMGGGPQPPTPFTLASVHQGGGGGTDWQGVLYGPRESFARMADSLGGYELLPAGDNAYGSFGSGGGDTDEQATRPQQDGDSPLVRVKQEPAHNDELPVWVPVTDRPVSADNRTTFPAEFHMTYHCSTGTYRDRPLSLSGT